MSELQIFYKNIEEIHPSVDNPRKNDNAVEYVANSINQFGFRVPIIIKSDGEIIAGHTRYKAAQLLNIEEVPCILADDLTEEQAKAFRIADNKVSEYSDWDNELLETQLKELMLTEIDMEEFGDFENFNFSEMADIDDEGIGQTQTFEHSLRIDKATVLLTDEEFVRIRERLDNYIEKNGVSFGFVKELLDRAENKN